MAPTPFEGAFGGFGLLAKTRAALEALCDEPWCRQTTSELRLLEAVLSQLKDISPKTASEETMRFVGFCGLPCAPHLECFLQELEKLQPDLDRYFEAGEDRSHVEGPPPWATAVERKTSMLMKNIGMQLQFTNALLRVESLQTITATDDIQQVSRIPSNPLSPAPGTDAPSQQFIVAGNENVYQGIEASGSARVHLGNSYVFSGVSKASIDSISEKLDDLASSCQAGALQSLLEEMQKKQSDSYKILSVVDAHTLQLLAQLGQVADGSRAMLALLQETLPSSVASTAQRVNRSPSIPRGPSSLPRNTTTEQVHGKTLKRPRAIRSANLTSILEMIRTWLSAMMMMLLMESRSFQTFIRSTMTFIRSPSMLLDSNILIVDALNQELSLPYEHFRDWSVMLPRLQRQARGSPAESYVAEEKFGLFRTAKRSQNQVMIPFEEWERSVFPGDRVLMSIDLEQFDPDECPSCGCALREIRLSPVFSEWLVFPDFVALWLILTVLSTECGQLVHTVRNDLTDKVLRVPVAYGPDDQRHSSKNQVEVKDIQRFARVHGRHRKQSPRVPATLDLTQGNPAPFEHRLSKGDRELSTRLEPLGLDSSISASDEYDSDSLYRQRPRSVTHSGTLQVTDPLQSMLSWPQTAEQTTTQSSSNPQQGNCLSCGHQRFLSP